MKRGIFIIAFLVSVCFANAQTPTLEEIVKKNYDASNQAAYDKAKTITFLIKQLSPESETMLTIQIKKPDKIRIAASILDKEIIQTYDGIKGYMVNPMIGSADPIEIPKSAAEKLMDGFMFNAPLFKYLKEGKLEMAGEYNEIQYSGRASVGGRNSIGDGINVKYWKILEKRPSGQNVLHYISQESYLQSKREYSEIKDGERIDVLVITLRDRKAFDGISIPTYIGYDTYKERYYEEDELYYFVQMVEFDKPMDDSLFTLKK